MSLLLLFQSPAAGGTTYDISPAGTVTSAGALANLDAKALTGTVVSAGSLANLIANALAGTVTSAGSLSNLAFQALAGAVTSGGALAKQDQKSLAGNIGGKWWEAGGATGCVAAYQAKGAANQADSYTNLANPGTNNLTATAAPTWAGSAGWTFNGTTQFLKTGILPGSNYSVIVQYANQNGSSNGYLFGTSDGSNGLSLRSYLGAGFAHYVSGAGFVASVAGPTASGNRAVTNRGYKDGIDDVSSALTPAAVTQEIYLGALNNNGSQAGFFTGDIIAVAVYNNLLTAAQVAALAGAMAGSMAPPAGVGTLAKQAQKPLAGAVASSGVLSNIKVALLALAGTVTSAGALANQAQKAVAGTVTSAGSLARAALKGLAGAIPGAGALAKAVSTALAGNLTPSGVLSNIKVVLMALAGTLTSSGSLVRQAQKGLSGTLSSSSTLARAVAQSLSGTVTSAGSLAKQIAVSVGGTLTSAGAAVIAALGASTKVVLTLLARALGFTVEDRAADMTLEDRDTTLTVEDRAE